MRASTMRDSQSVEFLQWALPKLRMRWPGFRKVRKQVWKRIARRLQELGLEDAAAYRGYLEANSSEWSVLDGFCRISIILRILLTSMRNSLAYSSTVGFLP